MKGMLLDNQGYEQFLMESQGLLPSTIRTAGQTMNLDKPLAEDRALFRKSFLTVQKRLEG